MPPRPRGFAMLDVLLALLLLALALTGACACLVQARRLTLDALLTTRAVDLASDLSEELRRAPDADSAAALLEAWQSRLSGSLPVAGLAPAEVATLTLASEPAADGAGAIPHAFLTIHWHGEAGRLRELKLPVTAVP